MVDTPIGDDTSAYTLVEADVGHSIYCRVTGTNSVGAASANSNTLGPVEAGAAAFTYIDSVATGSTGGGTFSTTAMDTTGAGLLILHLSYFNAPTVSDNKGNTWTARPASTHVGEGCTSRIYYVASPVVGSGHTVTITGGGTYVLAQFLAFSGGAAAPFDVEASANSANTPASAGAGITPGFANELVIAGLSWGNAALVVTAISGGFTIAENTAQSAGNYQGGAVAYLIQTTAALADPDWTFTGGALNWAANIASFKFS